MNYFFLETSVEIPTSPPLASLDMYSNIKHDYICALDLAMWDEFLDALLDEPHNEDLVNIFDEVPLRNTSLEIGFPNSSCSLSFSYLIGQLDGVTKSLSLGTPIQSSKMNTWRASSSFLTF